MTEQIESNVKEGVVQSPQQTVRVFLTLDACLDFIKWVRPPEFAVRSGVDFKGKVLWELHYMTQNRGD